MEGRISGEEKEKVDCLRVKYCGGSEGSEGREKVVYQRRE